MATKKQYRETLKKLKKNKVSINIDARKSDKNLTPAEKAKITRLGKKFNHIIEGFYIKKHVGKKGADTLEKNYGHLRQGNNVWLPTNGGKGNELKKVRVKTTKTGVEIERIFSSGKRTLELPLHNPTDFEGEAQKRFDNLKFGTSLTVKIGDSHAWKNRNFGSLQQLNNYMPGFYEMVAERDHWQSAAEVESALSPLITLVDFYIPSENPRGKSHAKAKKNRRNRSRN